MNVVVNYSAVLLAALSTILISLAWYARPAFGKAWIRMAGLDEKAIKKAGAYPFILTILVSFISAYVMAHLAYVSNQFFHHSFLQDSLTTAVWVWLGFTAARMMTHDAFEARRKKLTLITVGYELMTFVAMGLIIGIIGV